MTSRRLLSALLCTLKSLSLLYALLTIYLCSSLVIGFILLRIIASKLVQRSPIPTFQAIRGSLCPHRSQTHLYLFLTLSRVILVVWSGPHSTTLVFVYLLQCLGSMQMAPLRSLSLYCSLMVLNEPSVLMTRWNLEALEWRNAHLSGMKATPSHCSFAKLHLACFLVGCDCIMSSSE